MYVSSTTLLNTKTTAAWGVGYLALYNLRFVLLLLVILDLAGIRVTVKRWGRWARENSGRFCLRYGLVMIALAVGGPAWLIV